MGIGIVGARGSGKTRLMGRLMVPQDVQSGVATIIIDPLGSLSAEIFDRFSRYLPEQQRWLWPRVRYIDLAATHGVAVGLPLYFQAPGDSLFAASQRFPDVIRRLDSHLSDAPIMGWNSFWSLATNVGMILMARSEQITSAEALVLDPKSQTDELRILATRVPEVAPAVERFLHGFAELSPRDRQNQSGAYLTKIGLFALDPVMRATFGATTAGIDLDAAITKGQLVIFDFGGIHDDTRLRFMVMWVFRLIVDAVKRRGVGKHLAPVSLVIDELTFLVGGDRADTALLTSDLEELINRLSRNSNIWLTLALQELHQLAPGLAATFMTLGTMVLGSTSSVDTADVLVRRFHAYNPDLVRKTEPMYASSQGEPIVVDYRSVEFTLEEQRAMAARTFQQVEPLTFLVGLSTREGHLPSRLHHMSIQQADAGKWVRPEVVAHARRELSLRDAQVAVLASPAPAATRPGDDRIESTSADAAFISADQAEAPVSVEVDSSNRPTPRLRHLTRREPLL